MLPGREMDLISGYVLQRRQNNYLINLIKTLEIMRLQIILVFLLSSLSFTIANAQTPAGFKPIFNGKNLEGWHVSRTTHQGTTPDFRVENGVIVVTQKPFGQGGVLLSDKKYKNFEVYVEAKIDSFTNGGIFI